MKNKDYPGEICKIIDSDSFKTKLSIISHNYSNLKQENNIRNIILEELKVWNNTTTRAFAEHPRINGSRVDLSIIDQNDLENPYKIEFKFQFTKDANQMKNYQQVICNDFILRKSDLFILTISNWDIEDKKAFDKKWNISSNLSRYISKTDDWKKNIKKSFDKFPSTELIKLEKIITESPYRMKYYFYILKRI